MDEDIVDLTASPAAAPSPKAGGSAQSCEAVDLLSPEPLRDLLGGPPTDPAKLPSQQDSEAGHALLDAPDRHRDEIPVAADLRGRGASRGPLLPPVDNSDLPPDSPTPDFVRGMIPDGDAVDLEDFVSQRLAAGGSSDRAEVPGRGVGSLCCWEGQSVSIDIDVNVDADVGEGGRMEMDGPLMKKRRVGGGGEGGDEGVMEEKARRREKEEEKRRRREEKEEEKRRVREEKEAERLRAKEQKERIRQQQKEEKLHERQQEKERKAQEREDARRCRGSHALKEICVQISTSLAKCELGIEIFRQLQLQELNYDVVQLPLKHRWCISWQRRRLATKASQPGVSVPIGSQVDMHSQALPGPNQGTCTEVVENLPYTMVAFMAEDFVNEVLDDGLCSLFCEVASVHCNCTLGLMVVGLEAYLQRLEKQSSKKRAPGGGRKPIDDFLIRLTTHHPGVRYKLVADTLQGAQHVACLSVCLARQPYYRTGRFLGSSGGSKGVNTVSEIEAAVHDAPQHSAAFAMLLHAIPGVGPRDAQAVALEHPTFRELMGAYDDSNRSAAEKRGLLSNLLQPPAKKRRVGPAVSTRIHRLFTADDPETVLED
ncbi:unnamed protein product [Ostreobium quekettii]|uniref:ERCC4 domain-containing protein n=1 Tax=Ostreobium quekettii TaxID=121088 RepID=A0A8S1ILA6_9CHLO|nr:unnamed protein product [Ostreobium quekettii]